MIAQTHLQTGVVLERGGSPAQALREYQLAERTAPDADTQAEALRRQGDVHRALGDWTAALDAVDRSQRLAREHGLTQRYAEALNALGIVRFCRGEGATARDLFEQALASAADPVTQGLALQNLGNLSAEVEDFAAAEQFYLRSYRCFLQAGFARGEALNLNNLAGAMMRQRQYALAEPLFTQAMERAHRLGDLSLYGIATLNRGECRIGLRRYPEALKDVGEALREFKTARDLFHRMRCMHVFGALFAAQGDREMARRHYHKALLLAEQLGIQKHCDEVRRELNALEAAS